MNSPRILALLPFLVRGARSIAIFRDLRERGFEITIAYCDAASGAYTPDALEDFASTGHLLNLAGMDSAARFHKVLELLCDRKIDLLLQIGAADLYHLLPYWKERLPRLRIADILYNEIGHTLNHFIYEKCFDTVMVESEFMAGFIRRFSRKNNPPVTVVRSGVNVEEFAPNNSPKSELLKIGFVGRMSEEKNPIGFVELAEELGRREPLYDFRMFGTGPDEAIVRARISNSAVANRLKYHGFVEHVKDGLHQLDVLVLPSKFDGRPVLVMEANACGIPVIAAPVGGIPELVIDGVNGFLIFPTATEHIHALLLSWLEQPHELAALKLASRMHALEHFDREKMIAAYAAAFSDIAAS
ncbi:glycosyltransferase [Variovorax sp. PDNC026]|uniref:glycosyltransferase n=1 Tax=Variovorax sp. PDNC026 TaxID=2811425 RepID=UPI001963D26A|nr:glycosyltransferase [Variovorax sp. PDNC026]QRY33517.1 glycosyltransferase [Variovorax sp. PDNC026]